MIRKLIAQHKLAKHIRTQKALNADWTKRRNAQLSPKRKKHIQEVIGEQV